CSRKCAASDKPTGYQTRTKKAACERCGGEFIVYNRRQRRCVSCREVPLQDIPCAVCGKPVKKVGRKTCSTSCAGRFRHTQRKKSVRARCAGPAGPCASGQALWDAFHAPGHEVDPSRTRLPLNRQERMRP